jgi:hypothetical protein
MSQQMKTAVMKLLARHNLTGAFEQAPGGEFHVRFERRSFMPLVIEKVAADLISIAHYGELNGDAMRDPEMTFRIRGDRWLPASFENSYAGIYQQVFVQGSKGQELDYPRLLRELTSLAAMWARNMEGQGWLDDSVKVTSLSHPHLLER